MEEIKDGAGTSVALVFPPVIVPKIDLSVPEAFPLEPAFPDCLSAADGAVEKVRGRERPCFWH